MLADKKLNITLIYLEETGFTSDRGGHLWPGHQILRGKSLLKGENVASLHSGSNTAVWPRMQLLYCVCIQ